MITIAFVLVSSLGVNGCDSGLTTEPPEMKFKATGAQTLKIVFSGSGSIKTSSPITIGDITHFSLENETTCENRKFSSSNPTCSFTVRLNSYVKGLNTDVYIPTEVGPIYVPVMTE